MIWRMMIGTRDGTRSPALGLRRNLFGFSDYFPARPLTNQRRYPN
jgi:hypothetical protein